MGLVFGWLRSVRPTFGRIPEPALWVFDTIGLAVFIGVVGLSAGPSFVAGLAQTGPSLLVVGFLVAVTPHVTALLFGRYVLKMNPVILFGACSGAGTVTAALRAIQDEAESKLPVLGYTVPYAIGNILLTAWGPGHRDADSIGDGRCRSDRRHASSAFVALALALRAAPARPPGGRATGPTALPTVVVLATGGTIAGAAAEGRRGGLHVRAASSIDSLIRRVPGSRRSSRTSTASRSPNIGSQDMNDEVWLQARQARERAARDARRRRASSSRTAPTRWRRRPSSSTSWSRATKPVVLVGSMRPSTSPSADGPLNLYNAVAVAADPAAARARRARRRQRRDPPARDVHKTNTTAVQTFVSPTRGPIGNVYYGKAVVLQRPVEPPHRRRASSRLDGATALPRVDIVYAHENMDGTIVKAAVAAGAKGIVLAGVGDGNATTDLINALAEAAKKGVVVVRADARRLRASCGRNVELDDDKLGFVASMDLNPQKARVLLRVALTKTSDPKEIQRYFEEY